LDAALVWAWLSLTYGKLFVASKCFVFRPVKPVEVCRSLGNRGFLSEEVCKVSASARVMEDIEICVSLGCSCMLPPSLLFFSVNPEGMPLTSFFPATELKLFPRFADVVEMW